MVALMFVAAVHCIIGKLPSWFGGFQVGKSDSANMVTYNVTLPLRNFLS
jgi:hypothetical protein